MISNVLYGSFMLNGLTAQEPDATKIIGDFKRNSMERYKDLADSLLTGWALDAQQKFTIGDEIMPIKVDKDKTGAINGYASCPANGQLKLLHAFDSANFVPIGNTPYEAVQQLSIFSGQSPQKFSGILDANGMGSIVGCIPNSQYRIRFYPNVSQREVDTLYASYDGVIAKLHDWLQAEWSGNIAAQWKLLAPVGDPKRLAQISKAFLDGMGNALMALWDDVKKLFEILTNLDKYCDKLLTFISETDFQKLKAQAKDLMHTLLLIVSDEPLMFLYASAVVCWVQLLPPTTVAELTGQALTGLLLDILLGIVLTGGAGLAVRYSTKAIKGLSSGPAGQLRNAVQTLIDVSKSHALKPHAEAVKPLAVRGEVLVNSSQKTTLQVKSPAQGIDLTEPDTLSVKRGKTQNTRVTKAETVDDASTPAKNPTIKRRTAPTRPAPTNVLCRWLPARSC